MFRARVRCHGNAITTPPVWAQTHVVEIISRNNQYATNRTREPNIYYLRRRLYVILAVCVCLCVCVGSERENKEVHAGRDSLRGCGFNV